MSNLYATEPATNGKVIIETTAGEIEVELWGKEAPKAVRNFLALTMEGYYDGVIFHRVVPNFIIQTGDPTGTGTGGESFYGEPFQDEVHGRLKFNRRGLLGMANNGSRNTNTSQFFLTLDAAPELTTKHTLFGKVVGNTIYNVLSIGNLDLDAEEKPLIPPKIRQIRIIENPFDDIVPRITASERRAQQQARVEAKKEMEKREKRAKAKKNTGLLSFGEAEEMTDEVVKKKSMTRLDLMEAETPAPQQQRFVEIPDSLKDLASKSNERSEKKAVDLKEIRAQHDREKNGGSSARQDEIARMQADLRALKKRRASHSDSDSEAESRRRKGPSYLEQELAKYASARGRAAVKAGKKRGKGAGEDSVLDEMKKFSRQMGAAEESEEEDKGEASRVDDFGKGKTIVEGEMSTEADPRKPSTSMFDEEGEEGVEVDDDLGWMRHRLVFQVDEKDLTRRAEEDYSVIDPRAKARRLGKNDQNDKNGSRRGGRDRVRNTEGGSRR